MDKSVRFTLVATVLLGILLYAVLRFANEIQETAEDDPMTAVTNDTPVQTEAAATAAAAPTPSLPRAGDHRQLVALLGVRGIDGEQATAAAAAWFEARGYTGAIGLLGVTADDSRSTYFDTLDEATLIAMSEGGDAGATQSLARVAMFTDPFEALELYRKAAAQGSIYAVIKVAETLSMFADTQLVDYAEEPKQVERLLQLQQSVPGKNLPTEAYATALAALGDGGPPIISGQLLDWTDTLMERAPPEMRDTACRRSAEILIDNSAARQDNDAEPMSTRPPPVFVAPTDIDARMPCADTDFPIISLMNLDDCATERVIDAREEEANLHICAR
ncbi:MAG: hypothetical protein ACR2QV_17235 [Gammaproteobacteria bacterium]